MKATFIPLIQSTEFLCCVTNLQRCSLAFQKFFYLRKCKPALSVRSSRLDAEFQICTLLLPTVSMLASVPRFCWRATQRMIFTISFKTLRLAKQTDKTAPIIWNLSKRRILCVCFVTGSTLHKDKSKGQAWHGFPLNEACFVIFCLCVVGQV